MCITVKHCIGVGSRKVLYKLEVLSMGPHLEHTHVIFFFFSYISPLSVIIQMIIKLFCNDITALS